MSHPLKLGKTAAVRGNLLLTWLRDLQMLGSLYLARFIVWRALRRDRKHQFGLLGEPRVNVLELNLDLESKRPLKR